VTKTIIQAKDTSRHVLDQNNLFISITIIVTDINCDSGIFFLID